MRLILGIALAGVLLVAAWEFFLPRRQREFPALRRRFANIGIWVANLLLAAFLLDPPARMRPLLEALMGVHFLSWPAANTWLSLAAGFLLLDLMRYAVHRCEHAVPLFWRFHALHHSDPDVDVTTSLRHHPVEYVGASAVYWLAVIVLGIPPAVVLGHGFAVFVSEAVQHGNISLPRPVERWLGPFLVTNDMHRIHHSVSFPQANANYGAVLSVWDRLFGTYIRITRAEHRALVFGVRELKRSDGLRFWAMISTPWLLPRASAPR